ncbi:C45 family autoproteolytic acyltransferase/hydolase [Hanstruepera ponticola]|uniref:C45 family autoproteolytic acyltransferase/hydolase n=1 Tax=Hanstruepera ponticola TaxID=2042995 RepID=UPI00177B92B8|nr:C45 family peptidase [Hanstruepera ponticola]
MFKRIVISLIAICTLNMVAQEQPTSRVLKEMTLTGTGYELGLQHGKMLKTEIGEIVTKWKANTTKYFKKDAELTLDDFYKQANYEAAIKKWTPDLYEEVRGIAEGSGQAFRDILVLNLLDEFWVYIDELYNHHCSDVGVPSINGSTSYIAQNMDIENYTDGYQTLIRLERTASRPEQLILTHPGLIALNGMNETGVGVVVNTIMQLNASSSGLPVAFVVRRIINSTDKDDLINFIQTVNHASGQNYIIGIQGDVYDFEASANQVVRFNPKNTNGTVYHTNHPIVNTDVKEWYTDYKPTEENKSKLLQSSNSYLRLTALEKRMVGNPLIDDNIIMEALRSKDNPDNPVCNTNNQDGSGFTFASVIMTLTGDLNFQITAGPPDESEYKSVTFSSK